jgi:hypothetical protein
VTLYLVEHRLRDVGEGHLAALRDALHEIAQRLNAAADDGEAIRYVRSTVVAGEDRCICLFEASSEALVRRANELAQVPIASVALAVDYQIGERSDEGRAPRTTS